MKKLLFATLVISSVQALASDVSGSVVADDPFARFKGADNVSATLIEENLARARKEEQEKEKQAEVELYNGYCSGFYGSEKEDCFAKKKQDRIRVIRNAYTAACNDSEAKANDEQLQIPDIDGKPFFLVNPAQACSVVMLKKDSLSEDFINTEILGSSELKPVQADAVVEQPIQVEEVKPSQLGAQDPAPSQIGAEVAAPVQADSKPVAAEIKPAEVQRRPVQPDSDVQTPVQQGDNDSSSPGQMGHKLLLQKFSPEEIVKHSQARPVVEQIKATLNLGSDEDLVKIVKQVNPEILNKIQELNIHLNQGQMVKLEKLAQKNKLALMGALLTGKLPDSFIAEASAIVPELNQLDTKTKQEIFNAASSTASKLVVEKMIKLSVELGYLKGDNLSSGIMEAQASVLNLRKITLGGIELEDVSIKIAAGVQKSGILLFSGQVNIPSDRLSVRAELLGISYDMLKQVLEVKIAEGKVAYEILPWLSTYGGINLGVRSYTDGAVFAVDPRVGLSVKKMVGPVKIEANADLTYRLSENNPILSCSGNASMDVMSNEFMELGAGITSRLSFEANPRANGNSVEMYNGAGLTGHF